jgi:solute carrier family 25 phosphate transporter 23/24/25/41
MFHLYDSRPLINQSPVSRTFTAPLDRLRIFLITRPPDPSLALTTRSLGMKAITNAVTSIYVENGVLGFWIGNGLSVAKILPESAIKFLSYESSVRCSPSQSRKL